MLSNEILHRFDKKLIYLKSAKGFVMKSQNVVQFRSSTGKSIADVPFGTVKRFFSSIA